MSGPAVTSQRAIDVPATSTSVLPTASLDNGTRVLAQAPLGTEKPTAGLLAFIAADLGKLELFDQYLQQVYAAAPKTARAVPSFEELRARLSEYASIGHLVLMGHGLENEFKVGTRQLTHSQFAKEFGGKAPPITELSFDGCMMGGNPAGLREIAIALGCSVHGWSFFHVLDWWRVKPSGSLEPAVQAFLPAAERAAPYLSRSVDGRTTYSVADQEALYRKSSLNLIGEYFIELEVNAAGKSFEDAVLRSLLDPSMHRPRASAETRVIDSAAAQSTLEAELATSRPPLARVSVRPWQ